MIQLNPAIPLDTPRGPGRAMFLIDYSEDHDLVWVCCIDATGECQSFRSSEIKFRQNLTSGIRAPLIVPYGVRVVPAVPEPEPEPVPPSWVPEV